MRHLMILISFFISMNLFGQIRANNDVSAEIASHLDKMGDSSPLLNSYESAFLNAAFKDSLNGFDFTNNVVGFLQGGDKTKYFDMQRRHLADKNTPLDNGTLYIFDENQKKESGGYDAAILFWSKSFVPKDKLVKKLNKTWKHKSNSYLAKNEMLVRLEAKIITSGTIEFLRYEDGEYHLRVYTYRLDKKNNTAYCTFRGEKQYKEDEASSLGCWGTSSEFKQFNKSLDPYFGCFSKDFLELSNEEKVKVLDEISKR